MTPENEHAEPVDYLTATNLVAEAGRPLRRTIVGVAGRDAGRKVDVPRNYVPTHLDDVWILVATVHVPDRAGFVTVVFDSPADVAARAVHTGRHDALACHASAVEVVAGGVPTGGHRWSPREAVRPDGGV